MRSYSKYRRTKRKKSILKNRFFWFFLLAIFLIGGIFYFIFFTSTFKIKEIKITGNQKISTQDIKNIVKEQFDAESNIFFMINQNKIKEGILLKFPQIDTVNIKPRFPDKLNVEIKERQAIGIWCQNNGNCWYLDEQGVVFERIEEISDEALKIKDLISTKEIQLGEKVIEKDLIEKIKKINSKLTEDLKINIEEFTIPNENRLNIKTSEGWEVYFDPQGDLNWQLIESGLILEKEIPLEKRGNLEYIDLRFSKVYYKYH